MIVQKIISGGQTGVDTIGLEVGRQLGIETGGTIGKGFVREKGVDSYSVEDLMGFGIKEISDDLQRGFWGKSVYLPRTEQNVINSVGTVYFNVVDSSSGLNLTKKFASKYNKPFILNPTPNMLSSWLRENKVTVLNVAGNRGSHLTACEFNTIKDVLIKGILRS